MTYNTLRAQYAANARQLATLAAQATQTGRKLRGQTAAFWAEKARAYQHVSTLDDAGVAAHLRAAQASASARLTAIRAGR